jgi:hypothetical protein
MFSPFPGGSIPAVRLKGMLVIPEKYSSVTYKGIEQRKKG